MIIVKRSHNNQSTLKTIMYNNNLFTNQYTNQHLFILHKFNLNIINQSIQLLTIINSLMSLFLKHLNTQSKIMLNLKFLQVTVNHLKLKNNKNHLTNKVTGSNQTIHNTLINYRQCHTNNLMIHS
jgi:hypothetical protein